MTRLYIIISRKENRYQYEIWSGTDMIVSGESNQPDLIREIKKRLQTQED